MAKEEKISCDAVPAAVRAAFENAFAKATINDCAKDVEKGRTTYEITSTEGETRRDLRFYEDGRVMEVEEPIAIRNVPEPAKLGARMVCTACGLVGADVRPDWSSHTNKLSAGVQPPSRR